MGEAYQLRLALELFKRRNGDENPPNWSCIADRLENYRQILTIAVPKP